MILYPGPFEKLRSKGLTKKKGGKRNDKASKREAKGILEGEITSEVATEDEFNKLADEIFQDEYNKLSKEITKPEEFERHIKMNLPAASGRGIKNHNKLQSFQRVRFMPKKAYKKVHFRGLTFYIP